MPTLTPTIVTNDPTYWRLVLRVGANPVMELQVAKTIGPFSVPRRFFANLIEAIARHLRGHLPVSADADELMKQAREL